MSRRKYEPAQGVVPMEWHSGTPSRDLMYSPVIAEIWKASLDFQMREVDVIARIVTLEWSKDTDAWEWPRKVEGERIRRHARLGSCTAHLPLTLEGWPNA